MAGIQRRRRAQAAPHSAHARAAPAARRSAARLRLREARDAGIAHRLRRPGAADRALAGQRPGAHETGLSIQRACSIGSIYSFDLMPSTAERPPTIDPVAAARWERRRAGRARPGCTRRSAGGWRTGCNGSRLRAAGLGRLGAGARRPGGPRAGRAPLPASAECYVVEPASALQAGAANVGRGRGGGAGRRRRCSTARCPPGGVADAVGQHGAAHGGAIRRR